jgi:hypothetical protein
MTRGEVKAYLVRVLVELVNSAERRGVKSTSREAAFTRWRDELLRAMAAKASNTTREQQEELFISWWPGIIAAADTQVGWVTVTRARASGRTHGCFGHREDTREAYDKTIAASLRRAER